MEEKEILAADEQLEQDEILGPSDVIDGDDYEAEGEGSDKLGALAGLTSNKFFAPVAFLILAVVSFFLLGWLASDPAIQAGTLEQLDKKAETVTGLVVGALGAAGTISLIPGDAGSPIADQLIQLNSYFVIVLAAIYLEKYLVTVLGFLCFKILVPVGCVGFAVGNLLNRESGVRYAIIQACKKLVILGLALFIAIPVSIQVSTLIEDTYSQSMNQAVESANEATDSASKAAEQNANADNASEDNNPAQNFIDAVTNTADNIVSTASGAIDKAKSLVMDLIETLAILIVTSCVIPIVVLLFFLWLVKVLLGVEIPTTKLRGAANKMPKKMPGYRTKSVSGKGSLTQVSGPF